MRKQINYILTLSYSITLIIMLAFGVSSCEDATTKKVSSGVMKVTEVDVEDGRNCVYNIESSDIETNAGSFKLKCDCDKFTANARLELIQINEKKIDNTKVFYLIDTNRNITEISLKKDRDLLLKLTKENNKLKADSDKINEEFSNTKRLLEISEENVQEQKITIDSLKNL